MTGSMTQALPMLATVLALSLAGCAGDASRPTPQTVQSTAPGTLEALQAYQPSMRAESSSKRIARRPKAPQQTEQTAGPATALPTPTQPQPDTALPTRDPAQIMRIWIGPWEDTAGNLHGASHVYTEVIPRRWRMDTAMPATPARVLTPLQIEHRATPQTPR